MENKIELDLLCPVCGTMINKQSLSCDNNHSYQFDEDVFVLLDDSQKKYIDDFTAKLHDIRSQDKFHHIKTEEYRELPYTENIEFKSEWRLRKYSLSILNKLISSRNIHNVLEIGPYNGWLSNRLAGMGFNVFAVDYFADSLDGLKASQYYENKWTTIQMDIRNMSPVKSKFDMVIINHALQFFNNYHEIIEQTKELLAKEGLLILLGLPFFHNPEEKKAAILENSKYYLDRFGFRIELYPESFKGFLDLKDLAVIKETGVKLIKYPQLFIQNLRASFSSNKAVYYYGTYFKE